MISRFRSLFRSRSRSTNALDSCVAVVNEDQGEHQYLSLLTRILNSGSYEMSRNGGFTKSLFGEMLKFDLTGDRLPILTTKRVSFDTVLKELFWFISGDTNVQTLERQNVKIWHGNTAPGYLKAVGLDKRYDPYTDAGPIYSHQWRHFGAEYLDCFTDYKNKGVDQLQLVLHMLRHDVNSRRNLLISWDPAQTFKCVLPPCHVLAQFRVLNETDLHCHLFMRSADCALGLPYNICSYAILTHLLAKLSGLRATRLIISIGDAHLYESHWPMAQIQAQKVPFRPPRIKIDIPRYDRSCPISIDDVKMSNITIENYKHYNKIRYSLHV